MIDGAQLFGLDSLLEVRDKTPITSPVSPEQSIPLFSLNALLLVVVHSVCGVRHVYRCMHDLDRTFKHPLAAILADMHHSCFAEMSSFQKIES